MSPQSKLALIQDELDSIQCNVTLRIDQEGITIIAQNEADWLIARKEVTRNVFRVIRKEVAIFA